MLSKDELKRILESYGFLDRFIKISYFFYMLFDNLFILSYLKLIKLDLSNLMYWSAKLWVLGIILTIMKEMNSLKNLLNDKKSHGNTNRIILDQLISLIGKIGEFLLAANASNFIYYFFNKSFPDYILAIGGMISSLSSLYKI